MLGGYARDRLVIWLYLRAASSMFSVSKSTELQL